MDMPKPQEQHRKLQALAGSWIAEEKMNPSPWDPKGGTATARVEARLELDGFFLLTNYTQERGGQVTYRGHGVFGWDPAEKCYTMHWFDSMSPGLAGAPPARGTWEGNKLSFEQRSPMGFARYLYDFEGDGRYNFKIDHSRDGQQWQTFMEGQYKRQQ